MVASSASAASPASLTPREAATRADVSPATIRRWLAEGRLEGVRVGGRLRTSERALEAVIRRAAATTEEQ